MSDPSKSKSNIFQLIQESLLIGKGQKNGNIAQTFTDLSDLRSFEVRINFRDVFPWFLLAMRQ